jgi:hypothetical protein
MVKKSATLSIVLAIIFVVLAVITLPGFFRFFYYAGLGHAYLDIRKAENLPWDNMSEEERAPYKERVVEAGLKCAFLMTFGQHIPGYLFVLVTIGLLTRTISHGFRVFLRFAFFGNWILGMLFLALGLRYYGQALQFPESLGPAFLLYSVVVTFFGIILGIGKLVQRRSKKQTDTPVNLPETKG